MTRTTRYVNLGAAIVPFVAVLLAAVLSWNHILGWSDLVVFAVMYLITGVGVTIGFHRLLTHRSFATYRPISYALAIAGSMSIQGPVVSWVADHRKHHAHTDEEGDPHSPHVGHGSGIKGTLKGLWWAHVGWLFDRQGEASWHKYARDVIDDPGLRKISKSFELLVLVSLLLPFALGFALTGTLAGALTGLLWGGFVRIFVLHHVTWSVNSVCHFFGRRRFAIDDHSTNSTLVGLLSLGEGYHHNHHAFPRSAQHGMHWYEPDVSGMLIRGMGKVGLAWNVVTISPERQREKLAVPSEPVVTA